MTTTYTTNKGYALQGTGDNTNTWGTTLNTGVFEIIDKNLGSKYSVDVSGSADVTCSAANLQNLYHDLYGTLTGNISYILPNKSGFYIINNRASGSYTITVKPTGGTGVVVPSGKKVVYVDAGTTTAVDARTISDGEITAAKCATDVTQYLVPVGSLMPYAGASAPSGWLLCYGQAISRSTYSALYSAIGTTYGSGDGSTTFNLPDLRGRAIAGQDDMGGSSANRLTGLTGGVDGDVLGGTGGEESHTLTDAELADHKHYMFTAENAGTNGTSTVNVTNSQQIAAVGVSGGSITAYNLTGVSTSATVGLTSDPTTANGNAHNNVQPTIILNYIIKT